MWLRWRPIAVVLAAGGCATVVLATSAGSPERVVAALLLALALPGMAIVGLLAGDVGPTETLLLALGTSITVLILDSALLYVLGVRLDLTSWAWSLEVITVLGGVLGALRSTLRPFRHSRQSPRGARLQTVASRPSLTAVSICAALVAAALAVAVLVTGHSVVRRSRSDHFTQLWVLPAASGAGRITVGLYNHEGRSRRYRLELRLRGRLLDRETVRLRSGGRWVRTMSGLSASGPVRVSALSTGPGRVYRWVELRFGRVPDERRH